MSLGFFSAIAIYHVGKGQKELLLKNQSHDISAVKSQVDYALRGKKTLDFRSFYQLSTIQILDLTSSTYKLGIDIYDTTGSHLFKSSTDYSALYYNNYSGINRQGNHLSTIILDSLKKKNTYSTKEYEQDSTVVVSVYSYLYTPEKDKTGIIRLMYPQNMYMDGGNIESLRSKLSYTFIILLAVAGIISLLIARGIMLPLKKLGHSLSEISAYSTAKEIKSTSYSSELRPLVDAYNDMLIRVHTSSTDMAETEKERAWAQMAKIVAHEIKNPLTPMRLSVQSYAMTFNPESADARKKADELCNILIEQIDTLSHIADSFASFSTSEHAQTPSSCNICEIVPLSAGIYRTKDITINVPSFPMNIPLDKTSVVQIVSNIVKNALEAAKEDTPAHIEVTVEKSENFAVLSIKDNGIGMSETVKNEIFKPSFTTKTSGMGMGLAIIHRMIYTVGGNITCTSEQGKGSEFIIKIPLL